jgi:hypothetical protein
VVAAFEFHDLAAAGKAACQANRAHGRLGAGTDQAHLLHAGYEIDQQLGHFQFSRGRGAEGKAIFGRFLYGFDHGRVRVPKDHRTPGADIVHIILAVLIPYISALAALEEYRRAAHRAEGTHRRIDTTGDEFLGLFKQLLVA